MAELLVFAQAIEGLTRALGDRLDADAARRLQEIGVDVYRKLEPAYPLEVWARAAHIGAGVLCPDKPVEQGLFELGRRFIHGYGDTLLGRTTLLLTRAIGPRRSLRRMTQDFRKVNNYTETRLVELGPGLCELWISKVRTVEFIRGMIIAGLEVCGAANPSAETSSHDPEGTTYRVRWDEL